MATDAKQGGGVVCLVERGTEADALGLRVGESLADALDLPLAAHPVPRPGAVGWPADADRAAIVVAPAERRPLAALWRRARSPALAKRLGVPTVLVPEQAGHAVRTDGMGELVCGVDRSPGARSAAVTASALAERLRLPLTLVHAQEPVPTVVMAPVGAAAAGVASDAVEEEARDSGWDLLAAIDRITPEQARLRLRRGRPAGCLHDYAARHDAPLIVVGAPAHGPVSSLLFGSTAWELCRRASTPVMYVPADFAGTW